MSDELVAIMYYQPRPKAITVSGERYYFTLRNNISLCWVNPEHVDKMLSLKKECCGGNRKRMFHRVSETHIHRHEHGGR